MKTTDGGNARLLSGIALALATIGPVAAEEAPQDDPRLEEVVVTAEKRSENLLEVPVSIGVVSGDRLEAQNITALRDLAGYVAGLQISSGANPGSNQIIIRGIASNYSNQTMPSLVATYIDDLPVGSSSAGARGGNLSPDLLPYDVERIEVLKGPQGTLYGANAMGGLIKYTLRKPNLSNFEARLGGDSRYVDGSSTAGWSGRGAVNLPIVKDELALRLSSFYQRSDGWIDNIGSGRNDANTATTKGGRAAFLWQATDRVSVQASALAQDIDSDDTTTIHVNESTGLPTYGYFIKSTAFPQTWEQNVRDYSLHVTWDLGFAELTGAASHATQFNNFYLDTSDNPVFIPPLYPNALSVNNYRDNIEKNTSELRLASAGDQRLGWMVGAFLTHEKKKETYNWLGFSDQDKDLLPPPYDVLSVGTNPQPPKFTERALFANGTYQLTDRLDIGAGVRYAESMSGGCSVGTVGIRATPGTFCYPGAYKGVSTWMGNARFHFNQDAMVYVRVATGYRPGGVNTGTVAQGVVPTFDPDSLTNYEAGIKGEYLNHALQLSASAFHIAWQDIQVQVISPISGYGYASNGQTARSNGVELTSTYLAYPGLTFGLVFAYTDAQLTADAPALRGRAGDPLPFSPKVSGSLSADYIWRANSELSFLVGGIYRHRDMIYNSLRSSAHPYPQGPQNLVDLYTGVELKKATIRLSAKNLFNDRSYVGLSLPQIAAKPPFVPVQPRTIGLGVDYSF